MTGFSTRVLLYVNTIEWLAMARANGAVNH